MNQVPAITVDVGLATDGADVEVGAAFVTVRRGVVTTRFSYGKDYVRRRDAFSLSPDLPLASAGGVTDGLPGALADSAPDRWGRNLIRKRLGAEVRAHVGRLPTITEVDFLLGVSDLTRQGALRFGVGGSSWLAEGSEVPKLIELPRLLRAADLVAAEADDDAAVKVLLDAGSASLGGARPKASVRDGERLFIAKFPHPGDEWDVMAWEATVLDLAELCGIRTPTHRLVDVGGRRALLVERFDRVGATRVPYLSAMSLLSARDGEEHDYLEVAEAIGDHGGDVVTDLEELWRRVAFSLVVNNTDDHLRNHGFVRRDGGWVLSPVFDVNPNPDPGAGRATSVAFSDGRADGVGALLEAAPSFGLSPERAHEIWRGLRSVVATWRGVAADHGIAAAERERFARALDAFL